MYCASIASFSLNNWTKHRESWKNLGNFKVKKITFAKSSLCELKLTRRIICSLILIYITDFCEFWHMMMFVWWKLVKRKDWHSLTKNICHYSKRAWTYRFQCKISGCCRIASRIHVRNSNFKLSPIHASTIYQIPWIRSILWILWKVCSI